jgi:hypothetical protein
MTVLVEANMDGSERLPLVVIRKSGKPRCFKNVKNLPCKYRSNKTAWMTSDLFDEYLKALDAKMGGKNRKIVLFIDNCSAHPKNTDHLSNVHVEFLPENSTAISQPMDQGVIKVLKTYFWKRFVHKLLLHVSSNTAAPVHNFKLLVLNAMHYLAASWEQVGLTLIANCFKKAGFHISLEVVMGEEECVTDEEEECVQDEWDNVQEIFDFNGRFEDFIDVDDNVVPCSVQTIEQICVGDENVSESEEEGEEIVVPSYNEALNAIATFRVFIDNVPETILKSIREAESFSIALRRKFTKQSTRDSFFVK